MRVTRIGGPTILVELDGWRILIDPTFDPPGRRYPFALGTSSIKTGAQRSTPTSSELIDIVLVSHDHHADNLDTPAGDPSRRHPRPHDHQRRQSTVCRTPGAARPRDHPTAGPDRPRLHVTATPCRHGPPLSHAIVGDGHRLRHPSSRQTEVALWVTGDSVLYPALRRTARTLDVDVADRQCRRGRLPAHRPAQLLDDRQRRAPPHRELSASCRHPRPLRRMVTLP